jgi:hypothetical protein
MMVPVRECMMVSVKEKKYYGSRKGRMHDGSSKRCGNPRVILHMKYRVKRTTFWADDVAQHC